MHITRLALQTNNLKAQHDFYANVLGLACEVVAQELRVTVGSSRLCFREVAGFFGRYHFAFNIPCNQYGAALTWLEARCALLTDKDGQTRFCSQNWNADMAYFYDPQGNILELIARHELENEALGDFGANQFLCLSEIGVAAQNLPVLQAWFQNLGVSTYKDFSDSFMPLGDAHGLVIAVQENRVWFPDTGIVAQVLPTEIGIVGAALGLHQIPGAACVLRVAPSGQS